MRFLLPKFGEFGVGGELVCAKVFKDCAAALAVGAVPGLGLLLYW